MYVLYFTWSKSLTKRLRPIRHMYVKLAMEIESASNE